MNIENQWRKAPKEKNKKPNLFSSKNFQMLS